VPVESCLLKGDPDWRGAPTFQSHMATTTKPYAFGYVGTISGR
jgi:hypothetical protein